MKSFGKVRIMGTGSYVGEVEVTNASIGRSFNVKELIIERLFGIKSRRKSLDSQCTSDLALIAAERAIESSGIDKSEIGMIVYVTCSPDQVFPSSALNLQRKLGIEKTSVIEMKAQCAGFVYGLITAMKFVDENNRRVLLVASEQILKMIDPLDHISNMLFGDGASAAVLGYSEGNSEVIDYRLSSDPRFIEMLKCNVGTAHPVKENGFNITDTYLKWSVSNKVSDDDAQNVTNLKNSEWIATLNGLKDSVNDILESNKISLNEVKHFVVHTGTMAAMKLLLKEIGIPKNENVHYVFDKYGNSSGPQPGIALDEANRDGKIKRGDYVFIIAVGAGIQLGSVLVRW